MPKLRLAGRAVLVSVLGLIRVVDRWRILGGPGCGYVFTEPDGTPIHPQVLTRRYKAAARLAGVPVARIHDGRHTAITIQLAAGVPIHVVSARAGHSRVAFTLDTYGHALSAADRDAADQHGSLIHGLW